MNFSATIRHVDQVTVVGLSGQLTSFASGALRNTIAELIGQRRKQIILNVTALEYLDSSGVGEVCAVI